MTNFFNKLRKHCFFGSFLVHFPNFCNKFFFQKIWLCLAPSQSLEKINENCPGRQKDEWKDKRTDRPYFIGSFRQLLGVQKEKVKLYGPK